MTIDVVDEALTQLLESAPARGALPGVELITTHISWVLRTPTDVFKLKRPVRYDFVDFSAAERRLHACREEVRLNRRLAPDVYHGILPVYEAEGRASLRPPGRIIDHVVHMRRLHDQDAAAARLRQGRLTAAHVEALAQRLSGFYREARLQGVEAGFPGVLRENLRGLVAADEKAGAPLGGRTLERGAALAEAQLEAGAPLLARRDEAVCDGHGDLRLEHVYFEGRGLEPIVIDTVEFEPAFRRGDFALDVAFLAMELMAAGRPDLEAQLWSQIGRGCFDHDFFPLIDLYVMHRAAVRAKVALLMAAGAADEERRRRKLDEAARLWRLALEAVDRRHGQHAAVVCVGGLVGTGKSTVAEALVSRLRGACLSSDHTRKALAGLAPTETAEPQHYDAGFTRKTLEALIAHAQPVLQGGRPVIFDATFRTRAWRQAARELATSFRVPFVFVHAVCGEDTIRARLRARNGAPQVSDAREHTLPTIRDGFEPLTEFAPGQIVEVDTERPLEPQLDALAARLQGVGGPHPV